MKAKSQGKINEKEKKHKGYEQLPEKSLEC